jgi:general secretion pathway protein F
MPAFDYIARELSGTQVTGTLEAASEQEVLSSLAGRSLFPTSVSLAGSAEKQKKAKGKRISSKHLANFYSQLADLLHSGVPLLRSLELLEKQSTSPTLGAVLQDVKAQVSEGTRLADSLRRHPRAFNELAVSMVRAGEEGGFLEDVLKRIAMFTEHQEDLKGRVVGALVYPLFLMGAGLTVVTFMLVFFVPKFEPMFEGQAKRGELPWVTHALLGLSHFVQNYGIWAAVAVAGLCYWVWQWTQTEEGRLRLDTLRLRLWGLGPILRSLATARFCRILGTLIKNGVPLLQSLRISKDATGNRLLSNAIGRASENVTAGKTLARPLASSGEFSQEIVEMISVGEEANNLEQVLINIADNLERYTYRKLELFVRLLEPILLMFMAVLILFVVIALLMPVINGAGAMQ